MTVTTIRNTGYTPPEVHASLVSPNYRNAMNGRLVVYCHGAGGNGFIDGADIRQDLIHHANRRMVIHAGMQGDPYNWANPGNAGTTAGTGAISALISYMATTYNADTSKVLFVADSMGAASAINWAVRNVSQFGGAVLRVPAFALQAIHDTNAASLAASMETAYGGLAGLQAAYPTRDALHPTFISNFNTLGITNRVRVMYNAADPVIAAANVLAFRDATGVETIEMGGPSHAPWGYFNILDQYEWLKSRAEM